MARAAVPRTVRAPTRALRAHFAPEGRRTGGKRGRQVPHDETPPTPPRPAVAGRGEQQGSPSRRSSCSVSRRQMVTSRAAPSPLVVSSGITTTVRSDRRRVVIPQRPRASPAGTVAVVCTPRRVLILCPGSRENPRTFASSTLARRARLPTPTTRSDNDTRSLFTHLHTLEPVMLPAAEHVRALLLDLLLGEEGLRLGHDSVREEGEAGAAA